MLRRYCILIIVTLISVSAWTQTEQVDSLLSVFNSKDTYLTANRFFDILHQEELTDTHIQFTAKTPVDTLRQQVWYWASEYYLSHQNYEQGTAYGLKALPLSQADNRGDCLTTIAICYFRLGDFNHALTYAKQCNELDMKAGDPDNISSSFNLMAAILLGARQYDEAEKCILRGLDYCRQADNPQRQAVLTGMACEVYNNKGDYKQALDYARQALDMEQQMKRTDKIPVRQSQMAESLIGLKRYDEAVKLLEQAIPALRDNGNRHSLGIACNQMGRLMLYEDNDRKAADYFDEALQIFLEQKDIFNECRSRKGLYEALRESNPKLAMQHNDRYNMLRDSIFDNETVMLLSRYAAQLDNEHLQSENETLRKARQRTFMAIGAGAVLLVALAWLLVYISTRRQKRRIAELMRQISELSAHYSEQQPDDTQQETVSTDNQSMDDDEHFLVNVIQTVEQGLPTGQYGVEQIATSLKLTTSTFRRRLQQVTGETPKAYITAIQMQKAANMLRSADMTVNEVAQKCGFNETSSFSRTFKRIYGVAPTQYAQCAETLAV